MADVASAAPTATAEPIEQPSAPSSTDAATAVAPAASTEAPAASEEPTKEPTEDDAAPQTNGTSNSKKDKRKSTGGVPEHKNKKLNRKQSKIDLNLDVKPGELWLAVMKGYKNWPCVICDEEMLPETLLSKRPVSAMRPDGSYREDFLPGAKNARDRRYPIMFLGTNEFAWHVNTDLRPYNVEDAKKTVEEHEKKPLQPKSLWSAYLVAAEGHDLPWFKQMLNEYEEAAIAEAEALAEEERAREEAAAKKAEEDVEMADGGAEAKPKKEKKRKAPKEEDVDTEGKPLKTPKKIKIKPPQEKETPADSASKPKKSKKKEEKPAAEVAKPVVQETPEEAHEKMQKTILFLRHRLQKGFLSRDKPPEEGEMPGMNQHMKTLENYHDLDGSIIKTTKINKVLKAIIKLATIPREHEFQFKKRAQDILSSWGKQLDDGAGTPGGPAQPATNGVKDEDKKESIEEKPSQSPAAEQPKKDEAVSAAPPVEDSKAAEPVASTDPTSA